MKPTARALAAISFAALAATASFTAHAQYQWIDIHLAVRVVDVVEAHEEPETKAKAETKPAKPAAKKAAETTVPS